MAAQTIPPTDQLTVEQKLHLMETLWDDMIRSARRVPSIEWHKQILADDVRPVEGGEQGYLDWKEAKRLIEKREK